MLPKVRISKIEHRGSTYLRLEFPFNAEAGDLIRKIKGSRYSSTYRSWLLPFEESSKNILREIFKEIESLDDSTKSEMLAENNKEETILNKNSDEILIWQDQHYIYLKINPYNQKEKSFLSGLELCRNYISSGYWKLKFSQKTVSAVNEYYKERLRKWPSLINEINAFEENQRSNNKITAVISGSQVRIIFNWDKEIIEFLKTMPFHHWDPKNKWWVYAYSEKTLKALKDFCSGRKLDLMIDDVPVFRTISKRNSNSNDPTYRHCPQEMLEKLRNKRYSESTIRQYTSMFEEFINYHRKIALEDLGTKEIKEFIGYLVQERKVSPSYQNVTVNAIKFYYEKVLGGPRTFIDIDRPRREKHLPEILSRNEVISMISSITNLKHKFIVILLYSTGLRRGELLKLKIRDIDRENMKIWVRGGKGKKDRFVQLGKNALKFLDEYIALYGPLEFLFEGRHPQYSTSSLAESIRGAAKKAGIEKNVTPHKLRHSYATHMLEDGVDTRIIQELLGHESIKTTQLYSHVTNKNIDNIINPLDKMDI